MKRNVGVAVVVVAVVVVVVFPRNFGRQAQDSRQQPTSVVMGFRLAAIGRPLTPLDALNLLTQHMAMRGMLLLAGATAQTAPE
jgi:hypothetical protein